MQISRQRVQARCYLPVGSGNQNSWDLSGHPMLDYLRDENKLPSFWYSFATANCIAVSQIVPTCKSSKKLTGKWKGKFVDSILIYLWRAANPSVITWHSGTFQGGSYRAKYDVILSPFIVQI